MLVLSHRGHLLGLDMGVTSFLKIWQLPINCLTELYTDLGVLPSLNCYSFMTKAPDLYSDPVLLFTSNGVKTVLRKRPNGHLKSIEKPACLLGQFYQLY